MSEIKQSDIIKYKSKYDRNIAYKLLKKLREKTRLKPNLIAKPVGTIVNCLGHFISALDNPETPMQIKFQVMCAVGYIVAPVDLIPDAIPIVGFADDVGAANLVIDQVQIYSTFSLQELDDEIDGIINTHEENLPAIIEGQVLSIEKQADEDNVTTQTYNSENISFEQLKSDIQHGNDLYQQFLDENQELNAEYNNLTKEGIKKSSSMWDAINKI
ncbi:MAG: DUF1232 domain-containing protein [Treponema sp.]|nr:DUF1232 domain-containing protein [Treponema sp.]